jgi:hypothetical protein
LGLDKKNLDATKESLGRDKRKLMTRQKKPGTRQKKNLEARKEKFGRDKRKVETGQKK